ncbi:hypothetical protein BVIET440_40016 [Burkholderia vietnamiensis]|nr:hypothetical protein BVI1335_1210017 [Burkholderia vietnamiensis]
MNGYETSIRPPQPTPIPAQHALRAAHSHRRGGAFRTTQGRNVSPGLPHRSKGRPRPNHAIKGK